MIADLDEAAALDSERVGAKAATLARARRAGLPVLAGFVVESVISSRHMQVGARALRSRGSGGARLAVTAEPAPEPDRIVSAGRALAPTLVARSSTTLETGGEWAGAFTSYVDLTPEQLPKAVVGCWASAFSTDALGRAEAAGLLPGSIAMAVLVQPSLSPHTGGVAEIGADRSVMIAAVPGSPARLLHGWERGLTARCSPAGGWEGDEAIDLIGASVLDEVRAILEETSTQFGANRCEWAVADRLWILQLGRVADRAPAPVRSLASTPPGLIPTVRAIMAAPGALGETLVLPWAVAGLPETDPPRWFGGGDLVDQAIELSDELVSQVWGLGLEAAMPEVETCLRRLRGNEPASALETIRRLVSPHHGRVVRLLSLLHEIRMRLVDLGAANDLRSAWHLPPAEVRRALRGESVTAPRRIGMGRWEPVVAAVVLDHGTTHRGLPAAGGIGAGVRFAIAPLPDSGNPPHRSVVTAPHAVPHLSQLIWDAAGLVTDGGSAAAHVFESARSLGVPAVCGVDPGGDLDQIVAVDGYSGVVATLPLSTRG